MQWNTLINKEIDWFNNGNIHNICIDSFGELDETYYIYNH